jgi:sporadic carbohydrate cluster 2OG-Fe(II) oxygenase
MNFIGAQKNKIKNMDSFTKIESLIIKVITKIYPDFNSSLDELHQYIPAKDVNAIRLSVFKELNQEEKRYDLLWDIAGSDICTILGPDVLAQSKINFSVQMPGDESSTLGIHSDCWSGDSPYQINLWIPFTNCADTNSMFLFDPEKTKSAIVQLYENLKNPSYDISKHILPSDFLSIERGNFLIFNPGLLHGNVKNLTSKTRVSINIRYKSIFTPDATSENAERAAGIYYKVYRQSAWTQLASQLSKINCLNE